MEIPALSNILTRHLVVLDSWITYSRNIMEDTRPRFWREPPDSRPSTMRIGLDLRSSCKFDVVCVGIGNLGGQFGLMICLYKSNLGVREFYVPTPLVRLNC